MIPVRARRRESFVASAGSFVVLALSYKFRARKRIVIAAVVHVEVRGNYSADVCGPQAESFQVLEYVFFVAAWRHTCRPDEIVRQPGVNQDMLSVAGLDQVR